MYRSSLKQVQESQPISSLDLNYSRYLDFDNIVAIEYNQTYTTTQKGMIFGTSGASYNQSGALLINNINFLSGGKTYNANRFSIDGLAVNAGTTITRREYNGENTFGRIFFITFIDQTINVPDFSKMTDLSDMLSYNVTKDGMLLGKINGTDKPTGIYINNDKIFFTGYSSNCIKYVTKGMIITNSSGEQYKLTNWYYIPMEE
jgi:hypothetical protein